MIQQIPERRPHAHVLRRAGFGDATWGLGLILLGVVVWWETADLRVPRWETVGPALLPRALALFFILGGAVLVASSLRRMSRAPVAECNTFETASPGAHSRWQAVFVFGITIAGVAAMPFIGFLPTAACLMAASALILARREDLYGMSILGLGAFAVGLPTAIWWIAERLLLISLP